jgi:type IV pilus assembly protein PilE
MARVHRGFTLVELMIVVAVVGILSVIAVPAYTQYVQRSRRADAKTALATDAQLMERYLTEHNAYAANLTALGAPASSSNGYYTLTAVSPRPGGTPLSYLLTATPTGPQGSDPCGSFTFDDQGNRGVSTSTAGCW